MKFAYVRMILLVMSTVLVSLVSLYGQTPEQLKRASEHLKQGNEHYRNDRYDAAIASYSEYLKIQPRGETAWYNRGLAYRLKAELAMSRPDFDRAEADFSQAIKLNPKNADYWSERGVVRIWLAEIDTAKRPQAITDFTEAIKLNPRLSHAYSGRGQMYEAQRDDAKAMADVNEAIRLNPNDFVALFTRGKLFSVAKKYAAARADLEKAIKLYPNYDLAKAHLSYVNSELAKAAPTKVAVGRTTPPVAAIAITDPRDGFKLAEEAEKARDHRKVIDVVAKTLPLFAMQSEGVPEKDLDTFIYLDLLKMRAKAYLALKLYKEAQDAYTLATSHAIKNMDFHNGRANEEFSRDTGTGGGAIMASVQTSSSIIICKSTFTAVSEYRDTIERERQNDMPMKMNAGFLMASTREICAGSYYMDGVFEESNARSYFGAPNKTKQLNAAIERYTEAIRYSPVFRYAYVARAKAYRELGLNDLAAADEQKARTLPSK